MSAEVKTKKTRSPNFPALTLEKSLSLVRALLDKYGRNPIPIEVAMKTLGYTLKSSAGLQNTAALAAYGLIEAQGSGSKKKITVSELAFKILEDKRTISPERDAAIRGAALNPLIFNKIIERYPNNLPADELLEHELLFTYKFNKGSVHDFITIFRDTLDYAKVYESGIIGDESASPVGPFQEPTGDTPVIPQHGKLEMRTPAPPPPSILPIAEGEYEIAKFYLGGDISVRLLASAPFTKFTRKTIGKLIKHLQLDNEDLPAGDINIEKKASDDE